MGIPKGPGVSRNPGSLGFRVSQVAGASKEGGTKPASSSAVRKRRGKRVLRFWIMRKLDSGCPSEVGLLREDVRAECGGRTIPSLSRVDEV